MRSLLMSVIVIRGRTMHGVDLMIVGMIGDIAFMIMGMRVGVLMGMRMRGAVCMGVLMLVHMGVLMLVGIHTNHSFR